MLSGLGVLSADQCDLVKNWVNAFSFDLEENWWCSTGFSQDRGGDAGDVAAISCHSAASLSLFFASTATPSSSSPSNSLSPISSTPGWIQVILGLSGQDYQDLQGHTLSSEQFQVGRGIQLLLRALAAQELPNENHHVHCGLKAEGHPAGADTIHHPVFRNGGYYVPNTGNSAYTITEMITVIFLVDGASEHLSYEMHIVNTFDTH
ncbi:hypothetical protein C8Q78DRAFT_994514 [Trametes maxima]|nr:hypothetical protein C8Q78DRAFT_994514 [Trametes maxima]